MGTILMKRQGKGCITVRCSARRNEMGQCKPHWSFPGQHESEAFVLCVISECGAQAQGKMILVWTIVDFNLFDVTRMLLRGLAKGHGVDQGELIQLNAEPLSIGFSLPRGVMKCAKELIDRSGAGSGSRIVCVSGCGRRWHPRPATGRVVGSVDHDVLRSKVRREGAPAVDAVGNQRKPAVRSP